MLRTVVLFVLVFALAACESVAPTAPELATPALNTAASASTSTPVWADAEIAYMSAIAPVHSLPAALLSALSKPGDGSMRVLGRDTLTQLGNRPPAPATLAVIELYLSYAQSACDNALAQLDSEHVDRCVAQINALNLELARLYAERGVYPPAP